MTNAGLANVLRIGVTAACLLLGFVGFLQAYPVPPGGRPLQEYGEIAYRAIQLVLGQFPPDLSRRHLPLALQIARFALPISAAWTTLSIGWAQVRNRARGWLIRSRGDHLIVMGEGLLAEGLVRGERLRKGGVIAWVEDSAGRVAREAEDQGAAFVEGAREALDLSKLGIETARSFVAAADSDAANMEVTKRVLDYAVLKRKADDPLQIVARIDDVSLQSALEARLERNQHDRVELRLASAPQLLARQFLLTNPVDQLMSRPGEPVRVCCIGWSPLTEMMLVRVLASAHFNHDVKLEAVIADRDADRAQAAFRSRRPGVDHIAKVDFEPLQDDAPTLVAAWLIDRHRSTPFNAIYVANAKAADALSTGLAIETAFAARKLIMPPIYVHLPDTGADASTLVEDSLLQPFGSVQSLSDPEALLQERHDEIARSIHEFYLDGRLAEGAVLGERESLADWTDVPEAVRDENRLVADCYYFKLRGIGASILEGEGPQIRFTADEVEYLAEAEHRRWMAAKFLTGWSHGEVRDDSAKLHPDLVPYSSLTKATKDLDREQIRVIPRILNLVKRRAVRNLVLKLTWSAQDDLAAVDVANALARVALDYPDRRIILRGELDSAVDREILLQAADLGIPLDLVIRRPVSEILRTIPRTDRRRLVEFIRGAYALHACPDPGDHAPPPDLCIEMSGTVFSAPEQAFVGAEP